MGSQTTDRKTAMIVIPSIEDEYPIWICQCGQSFGSIHEVRGDSDISTIQYIVSGSGIVYSDHYARPVNPGDTFMLLAGKNHQIYSADPSFGRIWINFKGVLAKTIIDTYHLTNCISFPNSNTQPIIQDIHMCAERLFSSPHTYQNESAQLFLKLIQFLADCHSAANQDISMLDAIRLYIDQHVTENISIPDLSAVSNYSRGHVIRIFKEKYGLTPHQYLLLSKLKIAATMLMNEKLSIEDIAHSLGFSSSKNFSLQFERQSGYRPSVYRKLRIKLSQDADVEKMRHLRRWEHQLDYKSDKS